MWLDCLVFCDCGFQSVCPLMEKDKKLMETSWWDWLRVKVGRVLMGIAMLGKSLIQFSVDEWTCVPSLLFTWDQNMVEIMKIMVTSLKDSIHVLLHSVHPTLQQATTDPCLCQRLPDTHRQWDSLLWGHCSFLLGSWCTGFCCALQKSIS